ncbi:MAG: hypothetical protein HC810_08090 [Acaryochloridaceae cyanobacterium RL_2_7]|nr:hypothetical protein [Acaryochloridaceae cyanobacterium RL_2_7]
MLEYLDPTTTMTLGDGIRELRAAEGADGDAAENIAPELVPDIDIHDAIHVLFACPTNLAGEISAHIWTLFGTTMQIREMHRVNMHQDHRQVLADIGHARLVKTWFKNIPHLIATFFRSIRMARRWPASDYADFLDTPLDQLRTEFNIRLPKLERKSGSQGSAGAALRHIRSRRSLTPQKSA